MVHKNEEIQREEMKTALSLIYEDLIEFSKGNYKKIIPIATQLRALLFSGRASEKSLFFRLSEKARTPLKCYALASLNDFPELPPGFSLELRWTPILVAPEKISLGSVNYDFKDFLETPLIRLTGVQMSPKQLIKTFANNEAAHYDPMIKQNLETIKSVTFRSDDFNCPELYLYIAQIADIVVLFGRRILKSLETNESPN